MASAILTPKMLWDDFNSSLPLNESVVKSYNLNGVVISHVYFSGREVVGERVRIFGVYAQQQSPKANTILILPDIEEGVSEDLVIHFANQGYNVLSVDIGGADEGKQNFTTYPSAISYANNILKGESFVSAQNSAKETCWYEWCAVAKYAVSYAKFKNSSAKIGVLGVKHGSNVAWMLSGSDERVNASAFAFGAGWHAYKGLYKHCGDELELNDERYRFISGVDSQSYAQNVKVPVMFVSTTNSTEFDCDRALDTVQRVNNDEKYWYAFITNAKEILDYKCLNNVELFFEKFIKGVSVKLYDNPVLETEIDGEDVVYTVEINKIEDVDRTYLFTSSNDLKPENRVWRVLYPQEKHKNSVIFRHKVFGTLNFDLAFATVVYKNGLTLTSSFVSVKPNLVASTKFPNVVYSTYDIHSCFIVENDRLNLIGNLFSTEKLVDVVKGPHDILGISTKNAVYTYAIKNHIDKLNEKSFMQFDAYTNAPDTLSVEFIFENGNKFTAKINLESKEEWQRITLDVSELKNEIGMPLKQFEGLLISKFSSYGCVLLNNFLIL